MSSGEPRRARIGACTWGWSVFTRPPSISPKPVHSSTAVVGTPACVRCTNVPPEARMRVPPCASSAANSAAPALSESESSAARGQPTMPVRAAGACGVAPGTLTLPLPSPRLARGEAVDRFEVALLRPGHDVGRQRRGGRLVIPAARVEPVAHELLVEAHEPAGFVLRAIPVAGGIRGQRLVDEDRALVDDPELELGVREHEPAAPRVRARRLVDRDRALAQLLGEVPAEQVFQAVVGDVLVVAVVVLGRR